MESIVVDTGHQRFLQRHKVCDSKPDPHVNNHFRWGCIGLNPSVTINMTVWCWWWTSLSMDGSKSYRTSVLWHILALHPSYRQNNLVKSHTTSEGQSWGLSQGPLPSHNSTLPVPHFTSALAFSVGIHMNLSFQQPVFCGIHDLSGS